MNKSERLAAKAKSKREERKRRTDNGFKRLELWARPEDHQYIKDLVNRRNAIKRSK